MTVEESSEVPGELVPRAGMELARPTAGLVQRGLELSRTIKLQGEATQAASVSVPLSNIWIPQPGMYTEINVDDVAAAAVTIAEAARRGELEDRDAYEFIVPLADWAQAFETDQWGDSRYQGERFNPPDRRLKSVISEALRAINPSITTSLDGFLWAIATGPANTQSWAAGCLAGRKATEAIPPPLLRLAREAGGWARAAAAAAALGLGYDGGEKSYLEDILLGLLRSPDWGRVPFESFEHAVSLVDLAIENLSHPELALAYMCHALQLGVVDREFKAQGIDPEQINSPRFRFSAGRHKLCGAIGWIPHNVLSSLTTAIVERYGRDSVSRLETAVSGVYPPFGRLLLLEVLESEMKFRVSEWTKGTLATLKSVIR